MPICQVAEALQAFAQGEFLIVIDNPDRENEGDLIISAAHLTPQKMAFMIRYTSGLICVPMSESRLLELGLPDMVERNEESLRTAYTISCDSRLGVTTGISASDRAHTCNVLAESATTGTDIVRPGHIFPLRAREGGVLVRDGHTEAAVDLCKLAGLSECAAISEIIRDEDGEMARTEELLRRGEKWGIKVITIEDLKAHRLAVETTEKGGMNLGKAILSPETKLLSTILYTSCSFFLLNLHINRLKQSACSLGWRVPDDSEIQRQVYQAVLGQAHLTLRLRLTMDSAGEIDVAVTEITSQNNLLGCFTTGEGLPSQRPSHLKQDNDIIWTLFLDTQSTRTRELLPLIQNKTTSRCHYTEPMVRAKASLVDHQEVLLYNEDDEITEGTITNVILKRNNQWITPQSTCGLLNGVMRQHLIALGRVTEGVIRKSDLIDGEAVLICNAVRGVMNAKLKFA